MGFLHKLKHFLSSYYGNVVSVEVEGQTWIGFQCRECGNISRLCEPYGVNWSESERKPSYLKEVTK